MSFDDFLVRFKAAQSHFILPFAVLPAVNVELPSHAHTNASGASGSG